jgi:hypothetical protein
MPTVDDAVVILHVNNVPDFLFLNGADTDKYTEIVVSYLFNEAIDFHKFTNVTKISFPKNPDADRHCDDDVSQFDQPLNTANLPPNLEELYLGWSYNQPLDDLPETLGILQVGASFTHDLDSLPDGLLGLAIVDDRYGDFAQFDKPFKKFPSSLMRLSIRGLFKQEVEEWPPNLELLVLGYYYNKPIKNLPDSLKVFRMESYDAPENGTDPGMITVDKFPSNLEELELPVFWNYPINFPPKLIKFTTSTSFNQSIDGLPDTTEVIDMFGYCDGKKITKFPPNLRVINFGAMTDPPVHLLPDSVEEMYISGEEQVQSDFNAYILKYPVSLRKVKYGHVFDRSIDSLPDTVTDIEFHHHNTSFQTKIMKYPKNLKRITGSHKIAHMFDPALLPISCRKISTDFKNKVLLDEVVA